MKTRRVHTDRDPFAVLGVERRMDLCPAELEARYLALSREHHPDFHTGASAEEQAAAIRRAAEINDAYRLLRNSWRRAELLVEAAEPGTIERTKTLPQTFLLEAMELAERVEDAQSDHDKAALRTELAADIARYEARIREALEAGRIEDAAVGIHEARYFRKALQDIDDPR